MIGCFIPWRADAWRAGGAAPEREEEGQEGSALGSPVVRVFDAVWPLVCLFFIRRVRSIVSIQVKNSKLVI